MDIHTLEGLCAEQGLQTRCFAHEETLIVALPGKVVGTGYYPATLHIDDDELVRARVTFDAPSRPSKAQMKVLREVVKNNHVFAFISYDKKNESLHFDAVLLSDDLVAELRRIIRVCEILFPLSQWIKHGGECTRRTSALAAMRPQDMPGRA